MPPLICLVVVVAVKLLGGQHRLNMPLLSIKQQIEENVVSNTNVCNSIVHEYCIGVSYINIILLHKL